MLMIYSTNISINTSINIMLMFNNKMHFCYNSCKTVRKPRIVFGLLEAARENPSVNWHFLKSF